jgi:hypothetical protein
MRKILLAAAAVLAFNVHAKADQLPEAYLGSWCLVNKGKQVGELYEASKFKTKEELDECRGGDMFIDFKKDRYEGWEYTCKLKSIKRVAEKVITTAVCYYLDDEWDERLEMTYQRGGMLALSRRITEVAKVNDVKGHWCRTKDTSESACEFDDSAVARVHPKKPSVLIFAYANITCELSTIRTQFVGSKCQTGNGRDWKNTRITITPSDGSLRVMLIIEGKKELDTLFYRAEQNYSSPPTAFSSSFDELESPLSDLSSSPPAAFSSSLLDDPSRTYRCRPRWSSNHHRRPSCRHHRRWSRFFSCC